MRDVIKVDGWQVQGFDRIYDTENAAKDAATLHAAETFLDDNYILGDCAGSKVGFKELKSWAEEVGTSKVSEVFHALLVYLKGVES